MNEREPRASQTSDAEEADLHLERRFAKSAVSFVGLRLLGTFFSQITSLFLARLLGPRGFGRLNLFRSMQIIEEIAGLSTTPATSYHVAARKFPLRQIGQNQLFYALIVQGLACVGICIGADWIATRFFQDELSAWLVRLGAVTVVLLDLGNSMQAVWLGRRDMLRANICPLILSFSYGVLSLTLAVTAALDYISACVTWLCAAGLSLAFTALFFWRDGFSLIPKLYPRIMKSIVGFGARQWLGWIFQLANYRMDIFIVNYLVGAKALGVYAVAVGIAELTQLLPRQLYHVLFATSAAAGTDQANRLTPQVIRQAILISAGISIIVGIVAEPMIALIYGVEYMDAVLPTLLLLPGVMLNAGGSMLRADLSGRGLPHYATMASGAGFVVTLSLDFLLIPRMGIVGASVASSAAYSTVLFVGVFIFWRVTGISPVSLFAFSRDDFRIYARFWHALRSWMSRKGKEEDHSGADSEQSRESSDENGSAEH